MTNQEEAVMYLRSSVPGEGDPAGGQRATLTLLAARLGLNVAGEYADIGGSGLQNNGRPGFQRLLRDAEAGKLRHLLVYELTRLSRCESALRPLLARLQGMGVTVHVEQGAMAL